MTYRVLPLKQDMSLSATSMCLTSRDGDSTNSLYSPFKCLATLSMKKFFLMSNQNHTWLNLKPFPDVLSLVT